jgi:glycosyltransferase involved in cell wall biosynthesis
VRDVVVNDFREFAEEPTSKRALVAYLAFPLLLPAALRDRVKFSNRGIAHEIVRGLNELGYVVDVINFDNTSWRPRRHYDLFIGHAGENFVQLAKQLSPEALRIYFATGTYWREANERLAKRLDGLAARHGVLLPAQRAASEAEEEANRLADAIVCIGNKAVARSYATFGKVFPLRNGVFPVTWQGWLKKDFDAGKRHFLFFAGRGNVLKGLDLLLDAFLDTDMHLHVCQHIESEFWALYGKECSRRPNIHIYGNVKMRSARFQSLAARCNWIISATCTEGQPGAILECMGHGLIPIVSEAAHIDVDPSLGLRIEQCEVDAIRDVARSATMITAEECRVMAQGLVELIRVGYGADAFRRDFRDVIRSLGQGVTGDQRRGPIN